MNKKIAIIGEGISGLSCAYLLSKKNYDIHIIAKRILTKPYFQQSSSFLVSISHPQ